MSPPPPSCSLLICRTDLTCNLKAVEAISLFETRKPANISQEVFNIFLTLGNVAINCFVFSLTMLSTILNQLSHESTLVFSIVSLHTIDVISAISREALHTGQQISSSFSWMSYIIHLLTLNCAQQHYDLCLKVHYSAAEKSRLR